MDIHNYDGRLALALKKLENDTCMGKNKETIKRFIQELIIRGLSKPRIMKYIFTSMRVSKMMDNKDFYTWDKQDINKYLATIQARSCSQWTKQWYRVFIRRLFQWLKGKKRKEYPKLVRDIGVHFSKHLKKLPNEGSLLNEEDVEKIITACLNTRDRAFVSTLYESGCRISEIGNLRLKHVKFDDYGAVLTVMGKTGSRNVRVITSTPYLAAWFADHIHKGNPESALWVSIGNYKKGCDLSYQRMRKILLDLCKKAGVKKRSNPHSFRHARATHLANHLTEFQMNQYFGWIQGSDMPATYVHMSGKNTDQALLKMHGLELEEKDKELRITPKKCPRCMTINTHMATFCVRCAAVLDQITAIELEEKQKSMIKARGFGDNIMEKLLQDPEVMKFLQQKMENIS